MMKLIAYILSFYIVALYAIPCHDKAIDRSLYKTEISGTTQHNHQSEPDQCSPFCACTCCVSPVLHKDNIMRFGNTPVLQKLEFEYSAIYLSSLSASIWQPPKRS